MADKVDVALTVVALAEIARRNFGPTGTERYMRVAIASVERRAVDNAHRVELFREAAAAFPRVDGVYDHDAYVREG